MDERGMAVIGSLDRQPIPEPHEDAKGPPSRRRLMATLVAQVGLSAAAVWIAATDRQWLSFDEAFHVLIVVVWITTARATLRRLRATP